MPGLDFRENYEFETHRAQPPIKGVWGIHLSGLSCWHASFKARGRVRSMDSVDPSASQPRDGLHPVLEVRLAHAPHYKDLIARSHPAGPAISATATAGPRWNRQTWIPSANRPWLEIRVTPVKWIPPKGRYAGLAPKRLPHHRFLAKYVPTRPQRRENGGSDRVSAPRWNLRRARTCLKQVKLAEVSPPLFHLEVFFSPPNIREGWP